jgi:predicted RNase H-like HicB family nuclease
MPHVIDLDTYTVRVDRGPNDRFFRATVVELPGCAAVGRSVPDLEVALRQAVARYLHDHPEAARDAAPAQG